MCPVGIFVISLLCLASRKFVHCFPPGKAPLYKHYSSGHHYSDDADHYVRFCPRLPPAFPHPRLRRKRRVNHGKIFQLYFSVEKSGNSISKEEEVRDEPNTNDTGPQKRSGKRKEKETAFIILNKDTIGGQRGDDDEINDQHSDRSKGDHHVLSSSLNAFRERFENPSQGQEKTSQDIVKEADDLILSCVRENNWEVMAEVFELASTSPCIRMDRLLEHALDSCYQASSTSVAAMAVNIWNYMSLGASDEEKQTKGLHATANSVRLMVLLMCQAGQLKQAIQVLQTHGFQNEVSKSAKEGNASEEKQKVPLDVYDEVMRALARKGAWKEALNLLVVMERNNDGVHPHPAQSTYTAVIEACIAALQSETATKLLLSMPPRGLYPSMQLFEQAILTCCQRQNYKDALQLMSAAKTCMGREGSKQNISNDVYNAVISCCAQGGAVEEAMYLFREFQRKDRLGPTVKTYNMLMSACAGSPRLWKTSLKLLDECNRQPGVQPDIFTYTIAMRACARGRQTSRALTLFQVAQDKGLSLDVYAYTSVMDACVKGGKWKTALRLFDEMRTSDVKPNGYTYSVAVSACGEAGKWKQAVSLLNTMKSENISINSITYNSVLSALAKAATRQKKISSGAPSPKSRKDGGEKKITFRGDLNKTLKKNQIDRDHDTEEEEGDVNEIWKVILDLLQRMHKEGLQPDNISYSSAIRVSGAAGQWKAALEIIQTMKGSKNPKSKPNCIAYTNAILACGRAGQYEPSLKLFNEMKEEGVQPDRVTYNALLSCLKGVDDPFSVGKVISLWDEMCGRNESTEEKGGSVATGKKSQSNENNGSVKNEKMILPDIITLTDVIAALDRHGPEYQDASDAIFAEAVESLKIILSEDPEDSLDSAWEIDLSGMSLPVAKTAVRYILNHRILGRKLNNESDKKGVKTTVEDGVQDLTLITGTGRKNQQYNSLTIKRAGESWKDEDHRIGDDHRAKGGNTLRDHIRYSLQHDFDPPIPSKIPANAQGVVLVEKRALGRWIKGQEVKKALASEQESPQVQPKT